jgi:hypothetical protein
MNVLYGRLQVLPHTTSATTHYCNSFPSVRGEARGSTHVHIVGKVVSEHLDMSEGRLGSHTILLSVGGVRRAALTRDAANVHML